MESYSISNVNCWLTSWPFGQSLTVIILTVCGIFLTPFILKNSEKDLNRLSDEESFIQNNSKNVNVRNKSYRIIHVPHELGSSVPMMVFIHGNGGQAAQWEHQLEYFSSAANVLAIDLLGCGKSEVSNRPDDYKTESLLDDLEELLKLFPSENKVLICHSYGCCLGTFLYQRIKNDVKAMTLISVKAKITDTETKKLGIIKFFPDAFFDLFRAFDRRKGIYSPSVSRVLHNEANPLLRTKQLRLNKQSKTFVWKNMILRSKWIVEEDIAKIECPILLLSGQDDKISSKNDMLTVHEWCRSKDTPVPVVIPRAGHNSIMENPELVNRTINNFLIKDCGLKTMDPAWQILSKTKGENKWSMKNYQKVCQRENQIHVVRCVDHEAPSVPRNTQWKRAPIISDRNVDHTKFRPMKVMRQNDDEHCPAILIDQHPEIGFVIDITKDPPPYCTNDFENSHITYFKLSTISKVPPSRDETRRFIQVAKEAWSKKPDKQIAVHCHYGFNRTGFMICCYMIEELGVSVTDAIKYFEEARQPKGIKHRHFKEELYLRYEPPPRLDSSHETHSENSSGSD
ncbi:18837_t:CDS:10, partial [Acaulospora morrowiae]